jgi:thioredoxin reductase
VNIPSASERFFSLRASKILQDRVLNRNNIEIIWSHITREIIGGQSVEGVILENLKAMQICGTVIGHYVLVEKGRMDSVQGDKRQHLLDRADRYIGSLRW